MINRMLNPGFAYMLLPWFMDMWEPIEKTCTRLYEMMATDPQDTFCGVDVEDDQVKGIALAYKDGDDLFVWQVSSPNAQDVDDALTDWGEMRGCKRMVMKTHRPKAFTKKHGFKVDFTDKDEGRTKYTMSRAI